MLCSCTRWQDACFEQKAAHGSQRGRSPSKILMGLYRDNGKENGNYHLGFRVRGLGFRV